MALKTSSYTPEGSALDTKENQWVPSNFMSKLWDWDASDPEPASLEVNPSHLVTELQVILQQVQEEDLEGASLNLEYLITKYCVCT